MGYRKFRLTRRKNAERKRLSSRKLKTIMGRPSKHQKKCVNTSVSEKVCRTICGNLYDECYSNLVHIYRFRQLQTYIVSFDPSLKQVDKSVEDSID